MNLLPMKYYIVVADQKSITRAAEELHITQQTLSAHMAALEKELKCQLFQRRPKFELTYEGRVFYRYCQSFQRLSASMEDEFRDINSGQGGLLRLGIAYTRGRVLLPRIIPAFNKLYPKVQVRVKERSNEEMVNMLTEDELDVVIGRVMSDVPELSYKELYHAQTMLYLCGGLINPFKLDAFVHTRDLRLLADCPFLLGQPADIIGRMSQTLLEKANIQPPIIFRCGNIQTLLDLCADGMGACFSPDVLATTLPEEKRRRLTAVPMGEPFTISIAWKNKPYVSKLVTTFRDVCAAETVNLRRKLHLD